MASNPHCQCTLGKAQAARWQCQLAVQRQASCEHAHHKRALVGDVRHIQLGDRRCAYDESLLGTQSDKFALVKTDDKGGRGKADTRGAQLGKQAAANVRHQQAMLARVDDLLETPVYLGETKVCFNCHGVFATINLRVSFQQIRCVRLIVDPITGESRECGHKDNHPKVAKEHVQDSHVGREYTCWSGVVSHSHLQNVKHRNKHEPHIICQVRGCDLAFNRVHTLNRHIRNKNTHLVQLSKAQIEEYVKTVATLFKNGREAIKQEFKRKKAALNGN